MKELRHKLLKLLMNKYFIAVALFFIYLLFFDRYNIPSQFRRSADLKEIESYRQYYLSEIESNNDRFNKLQSDPAAMERYARETYFMKRDNEDVFIIREQE